MKDNYIAFTGTDPKVVLGTLTGKNRQDALAQAAHLFSTTDANVVSWLLAGKELRTLAEALVTPKVVEYTPDESLLDKLLRKPGIGHDLMLEWSNITHLAQNLDAVKVTEGQRDVLKAAFAIHYVRDDNQITINSPADIYPLVKYLEKEPQECLVVLCLDSRNHVIHQELVYRGSVNASQVRVAEVMRVPIVHRAPAIVVVHNHPSGDPTPSPDDAAVTRAMVQAGKLLDIDLLDHIVVGAGKFVSLKEPDLGFS